MSASETMPFQVTATFDLFALRFWFLARDAMQLPAGKTGNLFRGQLGKFMMRSAPLAYARFFAPMAPPGQGPSGLRDPPRPFVLRANHLDGMKFPPGERYHIGINLFDTREPVISAFEESLALLARQCLESELVAVDGRELVRLPLCARAGVSRVRVRF